MSEAFGLDQFGPSVRLIRTARKLTQQQLADVIGVHHTYISKIEGGHVPPPSLATMRAICVACGVQPDWLSEFVIDAAPEDMTRPHLVAALRAARAELTKHTPVITAATAYAIAKPGQERQTALLELMRAACEMSDE